MPRNLRYLRTGVAAAVLAAAALCFRALILDHLPGAFVAPEEDMDFAWFVPAFSLAVLWMERARIRASVGSPSPWGLAASLPFLALAFFGARGVQVRFELLAFVGLALTLTWALFGRRCAKAVAFPVLCLLFCMPLASYLSLATVHLRLFASAAAASALNVFGVEVVRQGNMIAVTGVVDAHGAPFAIDVANPCSGLRSIFALMAISVGYGYFSQPTWARRAALFALSVPIAVFANIVRILSICIVAKCCSAGFVLGFYHDFSGFVVFAVAMCALVCCGGAIDGCCGRGRGGAGNAAPPPDEANRAAAGAGYAAPRRQAASLVLTAAVAVPAMLATAFAPPPLLTEPPPFAFGEIAGFSHEDVAPSAAETNLLAGAAISRRVYTAPNGFWFDVTRVTSGANKSSLHRPELCLPSQGFDIGGRGETEAAGVRWRTIRLNARDGRPDACFAYTFFNQDGYRTPYHEARILRDVWDRSARGRIDRWTMLTVLIPSADARLRDAVLHNLRRLVK